MDKYTVDLDQVLNDFEYSELTDQYSNASMRNTTSSTPSPSQNNVTKHSINNVFHSLNEYLNTNINVDSLNQIDNNPLENKENYIDVSILNASHNKYKEKDKSIRDLSLKTDELLDISGHVRENNNLLKDSSSNSSNLESNQEICTEKTEKVEASSNKEIEGNKTYIEKAVSIIDSNSEKLDDKPFGVEENKSQIQETNKEDRCKEEKCVHNETLETENESKKVNVEEKSNDSKETEDVQELASLSKKKEEKIGFSDDLEFDESEINKLLDELEEEELDLNETTEAQPSVAIKINKSCEKEEEEKKIQEDEKSGEELKIWECSSVEPNIDKQKEEEENLNVLKASINNTDTAEIKENSNEENKSLSDLACIDSKSKKEIQMRLEAENGSKHEAETQDEEIEEQKGTIENKEATTVLDESNLSEPEKDSLQDSLTRPQDLPLISERKINLIGDPGSTPYNNIYKEIAGDSDTDYSTSSSPTFSDGSTTASTASIDEVHGEHDKIENILPNSSTEQIVQPDTCDPACSAVETENPTSINLDDTVGNTTPEVQNPTPEQIDPISQQSVPTSELAPFASRDSEVLESCANEVSEASADEHDDRSTTIQSDDAQAAAAVSCVENIGEVNVNAISIGKQWLGKEAPLWIPDSDTMSCLHCDMKFTVLKRRHHCRACGLVLCSKCCHLRFRLEYLDAEARVCNKCHDILNKDTNSSSGSDLSPDQGNSPSYRPNPNNPLEYCSTVSPLQQVASNNPNPPAVMVPVGVLKRKGSNKSKSNKSVMFCDGIRPGSDLTILDNDFDYNNTKTRKSEKVGVAPAKVNRNLPIIDPDTNTFIPSNESSLPPTVTVCKTDVTYADCFNILDLVESLKTNQVTFAIHVNLYVHLKIIDMSCCINKMAWCFSTEGLINVGQDEIVILLEYIDEESFVPKDVFYHINNVYNEAVKGTSVKEMGLSLHNTSKFLDSKNHAGFVYIRPTFQCLENIIKPKDPYLIGILIHRWETPWAKLFPLRLILRLGAEYRYYPSPIISTRHRDSVFVEIGHTIINLLADFRNFSYTLPQIRGLIIHMEDKNTTVTIPANRYDQVIKSMNNSSDHILAFAGNFSVLADSHLVCIQDTQGNENCYSSHAINIHNKPRKITGASFIVFNGALKSSSGLTAKSNIVEDGLMIQVLPEHMQQIRENLRAMKNHTIPCGCVNAVSDETVNIIWGENDVNFNIGVFSAIDNMPLSGIPSIRVHNGKNHVCINGSRLIRWTEVFIIKSGDDNSKNQDPVDVSRVSESIAKAACDALVKYLDLLVANSCQKICIRTTLHVDNVSYLAGSNGTKLPPIYMKSLDDELIPVLHRITTNNLGENAVVLELIFRILNV